MSKTTTVVPNSLKVILQEFSSCFTAPGTRNFATLIGGWIVCQARHSITRIIQASGAAESTHHSRFYRFLKEGSWSADSVGEVIFRLLLKFVPDTITLIIDDTLCHKSGPHLFGAAMHYDSHQSSYGRGTGKSGTSLFAFGHNWVVAALWIPYPWDSSRGISIPFMFRLYRAKKHTPTENYSKRTSLALAMVETIAGWLPEGRTMHLVADAEYACKTIVRALPDRVEFTGPMSMTAALYEEPVAHEGRGRPAKKGQRLDSPKDLAENESIQWKKRTLSIYGKEVEVKTKSMICLWYTVAGIRKVQMVITRDPKGRLNDRAYFTTDLSFTVEELLSQYARRWEIEVSFRTTKQSMGIQDPQNGWWRRKQGSRKPKMRPGPNTHEKIGEGAITRTMATAFAAHAIVTLWYFEHGNVKRDIAEARAASPWYTTKETISYADMLTALRREIWASRFSKNPLIEGCREKIRNLLPGWLLAA